MDHLRIPEKSGRTLIPDLKLAGEDDDPTRSAEAHDLHFLERTMRCEGLALDRAMRLYHHSEVVRRQVPELMTFFPHTDRTAIPLLDTRPTPHVIVTRQGHFVTCLAEHMSTGGLPVLPYARLAEAMDQADASLEASRVRQGQLRDLSPYRLLAALDLGPGHLTREMVQVIEREPKTYAMPAAKAFIDNYEYLRKIWVLTGRANSAPRRAEIECRKLAASVRMSIYLMSAIHEPFLSRFLTRMARAESTLESDLLWAVCKHPDGGDHLLEIAANEEAMDRPRKWAAMYLVSHCFLWPENAVTLARRFQHLPLAFDGWEVSRVTLDTIASIPSSLIRERLAVLNDTPPPPLTPKSPTWILSEKELVEESHWRRPISQYFPPEEQIPEVRRQWSLLLAQTTDWKGHKREVKQVIREGPRVQRNEPCPCGSGHKYKLCCLGKPPSRSQGPDPAEEARQKMAAREQWVRDVLDRNNRGAGAGA